MKYKFITRKSKGKLIIEGWIHSSVTAKRVKHFHALNDAYTTPPPPGNPSLPWEPTVEDCGHVRAFFFYAPYLKCSFCFWTFLNTLVPSEAFSTAESFVEPVCFTFYSRKLKRTRNIQHTIEIPEFKQFTTTSDKICVQLFVITMPHHEFAIAFKYSLPVVFCIT